MNGSGKKGKTKSKAVKSEQHSAVCIGVQATERLTKHRIVSDVVENVERSKSTKKEVKTTQ